MIIHNQLRLIVLFNAKTGSKSLRETMIPRGGFSVGDGLHHNSPLWRLPVLYPDFDVENQLTEYRVIAFYRDPVDRFLSGMAWYLDHYQLDPSMSVDQFIDEHGCIGWQYCWLANVLPGRPWDSAPWHPVPIELYNFHDFANEVVRIADSLGFTLRANQVPHVNESTNRKYIEDLTQAEIDRIKEFYAPDYAFFASKNIQVSSA